MNAASMSLPGLNVVPFVSVEEMMRLVLQTGVEQFLAGLAEAIQEDFRRWPVFDKCARIAAHSRDGVIELLTRDLILIK